MRSDVMRHRQNPTEEVCLVVPLASSRYKQILVGRNYKPEC
jgi:hypothetical protein